jgi:hypothetical protein
MSRPDGRHVAVTARTVQSGTSTGIPRDRDEAGAVLILALVFLIVVGGVVGTLANWTMNDLSNTSHFASASSLQYAADNATNVAIQDIRYTPLLSTAQTLNASPPSYCWGSAANPPQLPTIDGENMAVWCSTQWNPPSAQTRVVTFSTCLSSVSAAACAATPLLQAVVTFDDYPSGVSAPVSGQCVVYCGTGMTVDSWAWQPTVPVVTSLSTSSGTISGNTSLTITGTGFASGATTVNFLEETGGTPTSDNVVLTATPSTVTSTSVTVSTPAVIEGTTYFVTVTTPGGTSAQGPVFTYQSVAPTITGISQNTGATTGGTSVTIAGAGFVSGTTVNFVQQGNSQVSLPATYVKVNGSTSITAVSPAITTGIGYFVTVTTPGGTVTGPLFTYSLVYPTVWSVSPTSGSHSGTTPVTITGTGFINGAIVDLVADSNGTPGLVVATSSAVVVSASTITTVEPAEATGTSYFVQVSIPTGNLLAPYYTSSYGPVLTYQ